MSLPVDILLIHEREGRDLALEGHCERARSRHPLLRVTRDGLWIYCRRCKTEHRIALNVLVDEIGIVMTAHSGSLQEKMIVRK